MSAWRFSQDAERRGTKHGSLYPQEVVRIMFDVLLFLLSSNMAEIMSRSIGMLRCLWVEHVPDCLFFDAAALPLTCWSLPRIMHQSRSTLGIWMRVADTLANSQPLLYADSFAPRQGHSAFLVLFSSLSLLFWFDFKWATWFCYNNVKFFLCCWF